MNLTIDIGNSTAKLVIFDKGEPVEETRTDSMSLVALKEFTDKHLIDRCIVCSVVTLTPSAQKAIELLNCPTLYLNSATQLPIKVEYSTPETLGADRLAAVVGACTLYPNDDLLIIDAGTCITYEFVKKGHTYLGGNIAPGLSMRLKSLNSMTARLPLIDAKGATPMIGTDTETAIRSGVVQGIRHEMDGYISQCLQRNENTRIIGTGGDIVFLSNQLCHPIHIDDFLVPRGLNRILEYNI